MKFEFGNFFMQVFRHGFGVDFKITRHFESKLATISIYRILEDVEVNLVTITEEELERGITEATFECMSYGIRDFLSCSIADRDKRGKR